MAWIGDRGPDPIPAGLLDRVMYRGTPTTAADGSRLAVLVDGPQAHLAVQGAATAPLPAHFHGVEQFQLFVSGSGTVGNHEVRTSVVHYTDRYTVYGPLRPGPEGMAYATLRAKHDPGANFMPGAGQQLLAAHRHRPDAPHRNVTVDLGAAEGAPAATVLSESDGLRVAVMEVEPGAEAPAVTIGGAGAYLVVIGGAVCEAEGRGGVGAITWVDPGESVRATAGEEGCRLALLQFPVGATAPG